ncbi:MAG: PHP domain-containing protein [Bacilli bacterium]|jgi:histidinol-phosphatase (PHP family)
MSDIKFTHSYHNHTHRCKHAVGEDEDYILAALNAGITHFGMSDHLMLPGVKFEWRGDIEEMPGYLESFRDLKSKYREDIDITIGFEADYIFEFLDFYKYLFNEEKINYLILGQHVVMIDDEPVFYRNLELSEREKVIKYKDDLILGIKSGLFALVAHPEFFLTFYNKFDDFAKEISEEIINASIEYDVPLELNLNKVYWAIRNNENTDHVAYPNPHFWELVGKIGAKVVVSLDSHDPEMYENIPLDFANDYIKRYNLKCIDSIKMRNI